MFVKEAIESLTAYALTFLELKSVKDESSILGASLREDLQDFEQWGMGAWGAG